MPNIHYRSVSAPAPRTHAIHDKQLLPSTLCGPDAPPPRSIAPQDYAEGESHTLCGYGTCQQDVFYPQGVMPLVMSRPRKPSRRNLPRTPRTAPPPWQLPNTSTPATPPKDLRLFRGNDGTRHDEWVAAYLTRLFALTQPPIQTAPPSSGGHSPRTFSSTYSPSRPGIRINQNLTTVNVS